eukprot:6418423-Amphidinium_carterae.1
MPTYLVLLFHSCSSNCIVFRFCCRMFCTCADANPSIQRMAKAAIGQGPGTCSWPQESSLTVGKDKSNDLVIEDACKDSQPALKVLLQGSTTDCHSQ